MTTAPPELLAIFHGPFTRAAARYVTGTTPDEIEACAHCQEAEPTSGPQAGADGRFVCLRGSLDPSLPDETLRRHARWFLRRALPLERSVRRGDTRTVLVARLEIDDLRRALEHSLLAMNASLDGRSVAAEIRSLAFLYGVANRAEDGFEALRTLATLPTPPRARIALLFGAASLALEVGRAQEAEAFVHDALAVADEHGRDEQDDAEAHLLLADAALGRLENRKALEHLERARSTPLRSASFRARHELLAATAALRKGETAKARGHIEAMNDLVRSSGDAWLGAHATLCQLRLERYEGSRPVARLAIALAEAAVAPFDNDRLSTDLLTQRAAIEVREGRYEEAVATYDAAVARARRHPRSDMAATTMNDCAVLLNDLGRHGQARDLLKETIALAERSGSSRGRMLSLLNLANNVSVPAEGIAVAEAARELAHRHGQPMVLGIAELTLASLRAQIGDFEGAERALSAARKHLDVDRSAGYRIDCEIVALEIAKLRQDHERELRLTAVIVPGLEALTQDAPFLALSGYALCYPVLRRSGDPRWVDALERGYRLLEELRAGIAPERRRSFVDSSPLRVQLERDHRQYHATLRN